MAIDNLANVKSATVILAARHFGSTTLWQHDNLATQHFGNTTFWQHNILATRHFGSTTFWHLLYFRHHDILATRHFGTSAFCHQDILPTQHFGSSHSGSTTFWQHNILAALLAQLSDMNNLLLAGYSPTREGMRATRFNPGGHSWSLI